MMNKLKTLILLSFISIGRTSTDPDCSVIGKIIFELVIEDGDNVNLIGGCSKAVANDMIAQLLSSPSTILSSGNVISAVVDDAAATATCTAASTTTVTVAPTTDKVSTSNVTTVDTTPFVSTAAETSGTTNADTTEMADATSTPAFSLTSAAGPETATTTPTMPSSTVEDTETSVSGTTKAEVSSVARTSSLDDAREADGIDLVPIIVGVVAAVCVCLIIVLIIVCTLCRNRRSAVVHPRRRSGHSSVPMYSYSRSARSGRSSGHYRHNSRQLGQSVDRSRTPIYSSPNRPSSNAYGFIPGHLASDASSQDQPYGLMPAMHSTPTLSIASAANTDGNDPSSVAMIGTACDDYSQAQAHYVQVPQSTYVNATVLRGDSASNAPTDHYSVMPRRNNNGYTPAPSNNAVLLTMILALIVAIGAQMPLFTVVRIEVSGANRCRFDAEAARAEIMNALRTIYSSAVVSDINLRSYVLNTPRFTHEGTCSVPCTRLTALSSFASFDEVMAPSTDFPSLCVGRRADGRLFGLGIPTLENWPSSTLPLLDLPLTLPKTTYITSFKSIYNMPSYGSRIDVGDSGRVMTAAPTEGVPLFVSLFEFNLDVTEDGACFTQLPAISPYTDASLTTNRRPLSVRLTHHWVFLHGAVTVSAGSANLLFIAPDFLPPREVRLLGSASVSTVPERRYSVSYEVLATGFVEVFTDFALTPMEENMYTRTFYFDNLLWERDMTGIVLSGEPDARSEEPVNWTPIDVSNPLSTTTQVGTFMFPSCTRDRDTVYLGGRFSLQPPTALTGSFTYFVGVLPAECPPTKRIHILAVGTQSASNQSFVSRMDVAANVLFLKFDQIGAEQPTVDYVFSLDGLSYTTKNEV